MQIAVWYVAKVACFYGERFWYRDISIIARNICVKEFNFYLSYAITACKVYKIFLPDGTYYSYLDKNIL